MASPTTNPQKFLNSLKPKELNDLITAMFPPGLHYNLINPRHISSSLNLDELATMTSIRQQD
ncbi:unnamed protein product, partial [Rotaria sp. Silwood1]